MKIIEDINNPIFLSEIKRENNIYTKEIIRLRNELENICNWYDSITSSLEDYMGNFTFNFKTTIKKKKLSNILDLDNFSNLSSKIGSTKQLYDEKIEKTDIINITDIHIIFKEIIKAYYIAINLIRLSKNNNINQLFNLYLEVNKNNYLVTDLFKKPTLGLNLINNDIVKSKVENMVNDYLNKINEREELLNITDNYIFMIEKYFNKIRRESGNKDLETLRMYKEYLLDFVTKTGIDKKEKRI